MPRALPPGTKKLDLTELRRRAKNVRVTNSGTTAVRATITVAQYAKLVDLAERFNRPVGTIVRHCIEYGIGHYETLQDARQTFFHREPPAKPFAIEAPPEDRADERKTFGPFLPRSAPVPYREPVQQNVFEDEALGSDTPG